MNHSYAIFDDLGLALETRQSRTVITPTATSPASLATLARASYPKSSGRWYFTMLCWGDEDLAARIGIATASASDSTALGGDANGYGLDTDGKVYNDGTGTDTGTTFGKGDVIGLLLDITTASPFVQWFVNGTSVYTQDLTDVGPWYIAASIACTVDYGVQMFLNSGQRKFENAPTGCEDGWYAPIVATQGARLADTSILMPVDDDAPNLRYHDALQDGTQTEGYRALSFWPWGDQVNSGSMTIEAVNDGSLTPMLKGSPRDMAVTVRKYDDGKTALYTAVVDSISADSDGLCTITCRDPLALLQVPLQRWMIRPDRDPDSANTPRPILLGACRNVPIKQIDATKYVFACADQPMMGIGFCRVAGYPLDPAAGDFTLNDDKIDVTLAAGPDGVVTLDASSVGGQQLPDVTKDIYGGAGDPFAGDVGDTPTGWDDVGAEVTGGEPVMGVDGLTFPVVQASPTVYVKMPVCCIGVTGSAALRIQWLDSSGDVIREKLSDLYTGTTSPTYEMAEVLDSLPDGGVAARVQAVAFDHTAGTIRVGDIEAYYVRWGDRTAVGALQNGDFSSGDLTGWTAIGGDTDKWTYESTSSIKGHDVTMDNVWWKGSTSGSNSGMLVNNATTGTIAAGTRINVTCMAALYQGDSKYRPTAQVGMLWYNLSDKVIGWSFCDGMYKGNQGQYSMLSDAAYAPSGVSYGRLALNAGMSANQDGQRGPHFAQCAWDYVAEPSAAQGADKTQVQIGTFADGTLWDLGPGWTIHAAGANGPSGAEYAEHLP